MDVPTTIKIPNRANTLIIGIIHQSRFLHKKASNSPAITNLPRISRNNKYPPTQAAHWINAYSYHVLSISQLSITNVSSPLFENVFKASSGLFTIGSPLTLKDVFNNKGTPVAFPNLSISS